MAMQKTTIGIALAAGIIGLVSITLVAGLLTASRTVPNSGNLKSVGVVVCWDAACTNLTSSISWGILEPGSAKDMIVFVKNNGTVGTILNLTISAWNPSLAASHMSLDWNCTGFALGHDKVVAALLTLSVAPEADEIVNFSFDMTIVGTENI